MNNIETLKNELINQKNILESKKYSVAVANINPSPSEITECLKTISENNENASLFSTYYKTLVDPTTYNYQINNMVFPDEIVTIRNNFAYNLGNLLTGSLNIPDTVTNIGSRAFSTTSISSVTFPTNLTELGNYAFSDCPNLKSIVLPDSLTTLGTYCFNNTSEITELRFGKNLTNIPISVFKTLNQLTTVTIPANITSIASNNFYTVPLLENVYIEGNNTTLSSSSIFYSHNANLKIWVNFDVIATYAKSTNVTRVKDHLISEVLVEDTSFPTNTNVSFVWYRTVEDATNNVNALTAPNGSGTYYCKISV